MKFCSKIFHNEAWSIKHYNTFTAYNRWITMYPAKNCRTGQPGLNELSINLHYYRYFASNMHHHWCYECIQFWALLFDVAIEYYAYRLDNLQWIFFASINLFVLFSTLMFASRHISRLLYTMIWLMFYSKWMNICLHFL